MARRNVTYELDAEESKMLDGFRRAIAKTREMDRAVSQTTKKTTRGFDVMGLKLGQYQKAIGFLSGGAGIATVTNMVLQSLDRQVRKTREFEREITGLLSLGDNVKDINAVRKEVIGLSSGFDQSTATIADFLFDLQSGTANLSKDIREGLKAEAIELTRVTGADLPVSLRVLNKSFQTYGDQVRTVNDLQNKLFITAEDGYTTFEELGTLLPDIVPAAKALGFELDEVLGSLITATQTGGKSEKTFTGVRNVFLRLGDAQKKGIKLQGTFIEQMEQLSHMDGETLKELFGAEAISAAASLAQHVDDLRENIEKVRDVSGDLAREKLFARLSDQASFNTMIQNNARRMIENEDIQLGGAAQKIDTDFQLAKLGIVKKVGSTLGNTWAGNAGAAAEAMTRAAGSQIENSALDLFGWLQGDEQAEKTVLTIKRMGAMVGALAKRFGGAQMLMGDKRGMLGVGEETLATQLADSGLFDEARAFALARGIAPTGPTRDPIKEVWGIGGIGSLTVGDSSGENFRKAQEFLADRAGVTGGNLGDSMRARARVSEEADGILDFVSAPQPKPMTRAEIRERAAGDAERIQAEREALVEQQTSAQKENTDAIKQLTAVLANRGGGNGPRQARPVRNASAE